MQHSLSSRKAIFIDRLRSGTTLLLDGGLSNQLESQGGDLNNPLWSALLLKEAPNEIINAHRFYLDAGADCIISASYQASVSGFQAIVVYPNSGEHYQPQTKTWSGTTTPDACGAAASQWVASGAAVVGGCCRMGPDHIKAMKDCCGC